MVKTENRVEFTKEMKKDYKILVPMMAPIHFEILKDIFVNEGYDFEILRNMGPNVVQEGLKYVHNDTCYPALLVIGQFLDALNSGKYDVNKTALIITQTGGGCRASNYIHLLRKALKKAGYPQVPVISLNMSGLEKNSGFKLTLNMGRKILATGLYGDALMLMSNQIKPYEVNKGETMRLVKTWTKKIRNLFKDNKGFKLKEMQEHLAVMVEDFSRIKINKVPKVKVGIVGEIYVKYSGLGNNSLEDFLATQDCEVMLLGILAFALFKIDNRLEDIKLYGGSKLKYFVVKTLFDYALKIETMMFEEMRKYDCFTVPKGYMHTKELVKGIIGYGSKMGEGWLLTAEMLELTELGYGNIVCAQPFGCLPNHICGKGMIRKIKEVNDEANIVAIDYDPGATKVNQENRIKLMLSIAKEKLPVEV